jgi:preprotein translocase subunit SecD
MKATGPMAVVLRLRHLAAPVVAALLVAGCGTTVTPAPPVTTTPVGNLGTRVTYAVAGSDGSPAPADLVEATRATLEARARVTDPGATVVAGGDGRLVLESGGAISPEERRALLASGMVLFVPLPVERFGTGTSTGPESLQPGDALPPGLEPLLRAGDIDPAGVALDPGSGGSSAGVTLRFTPAGGVALAAWSADHVGDFLAIVVDGRVVSVPLIMAPLTDGTMTIAPAASDEWPTADDLAVLRGAYPAQVTLVEESIERFPTP